MSLVNLITVDLVANTSTLTSAFNLNPVETIQYVKATQLVTFSSRGQITISAIDFANFISQVVLFETSIVTNFSPNSSYITPFNSLVSSESFSLLPTTQTLICNEIAGNNIVNYVATAGAGVQLAKRPTNVSIPFSEWILVFASLNHYLL